MLPTSVNRSKVLCRTAGTEAAARVLRSVAYVVIRCIGWSAAAMQRAVVLLLAVTLLLQSCEISAQYFQQMPMTAPCYTGGFCRCSAARNDTCRRACIACWQHNAVAVQLHTAAQGCTQISTCSNRSCSFAIKSFITISSSPFKH